jgi:hypothetical protein
MQAHRVRARHWRRRPDAGRNYEPMMREIADDVTGEPVPDAAHWVAEESAAACSRLFATFDARVRANREETP